MKTAKLTLLSLLVSTQTLFAAPSVEKDLGTIGNWKAAQIKEHEMFAKDACVADTKALESASLLQVFAEKQTDSASEYVEPTVLFINRGEPAFVRGVLTDENRSVQIQMTLASTTANPPALGLMARIDDRAKLIALIKAANTARLQLINEKNKVVKVLNFSLKGSSKTVDALNKACALTVSN